MSTIFSKKYSGKIKRMISEGQACPSSLPDLHLKKEKTINIDIKNIEGNFPSKIFNIVQKKNTTEITTNTLGIKITDKVFKDVAYYSKLVVTPQNISDLDSLGIDYVVEDQIVYLNTTKNYLQLGTELYTVIPVIGLDVWNRSPLVNIRRLKDRFKLTIKSNIELQIELLSESILEPTLQNNWVTFNDCVHTFDKKVFSYLYTHSFEYYDKVEIHEKSSNINLRDVPISIIHIEDFTDDYYKISYKTFRSNMQLNNELNSNLFISIKIKDGLTYLETRQTREDADYLILVTKEETKIKDITVNPYLSSPLYKSKAENYYFTWETSTKYATSLNVPIGCERVILDFTKILNKRIPTLYKDTHTIYEDNTDKSISELSTSTYEGKNNLDNLLTILTNNLG